MKIKQRNEEKREMMKKYLTFLMTALVMILMTACTPTTEKNKLQAGEGPAGQSTAATTAGSIEEMVEDRNKGNENLPVFASVLIYHGNEDGTGLVQEMEGLEKEDMNEQDIIALLIGYGVLGEGTEILSFNVSGKEGVLDLNQITDETDELEKRIVLESLVNTFVENYELDNIQIKENGAVYTLDSVKSQDGKMMFNDKYRELK